MDPRAGVNPRASLDGCGKSPSPHRDSIPRTVQPVAVAIPAELPRPVTVIGAFEFSLLKCDYCVCISKDKY